MYEYDFFEEHLLQNNIIVNIADMPTYIKGLTVKKFDYYIILLNAKFDIFQKKIL